MDPTLSPRRLKLRLLICNPKSYGPKNITVKGRTSNGGTARTREDPYLPSVFTYECKTAEEWQMLTTGISKQISNQNSFHAYAHFVDASLPPGPAGRVMCEAGGVYLPEVSSSKSQVSSRPAAEGSAGTLARSDSAPVVQLPIAPIPGQTFEIISKQQEGSEPSEAHNLGEGGSTSPPATISPTLQYELQREQRLESELSKFSPTAKDSQSGSVGEALVESEATLSAEDEETPIPAPEVIESPLELPSVKTVVAAIAEDDAANGTSQEKKWQKTTRMKESSASPPIASLKTPKPPSKKAAGKKK